jgi:hypothetical protein
MTPEERFHELDIAGCTWELMRQIDEQELIRIIRDSVWRSVGQARTGVKFPHSGN